MPELSAVCVAVLLVLTAPCRPPIFSARAPVFMLNKQEPLAALYLQPRHEQILAHALCPDAYTPNGFVFRTTTPCDPFRPRAGFHVKQTRTPRCSISSTASRVNSRPRPLPGSLFHLSVLNDYLARTLPPARWYPCQTNKSFSSPSCLYNVAPFVSGIRAKQTRTSRHPMLLTAPQAFSHTLCAPRIAMAQQHIKTASHPRLASKQEVAAHACFYA